MAVFVPPLIGGAAAGAAMYQMYNPPRKQAPESQNAPRNVQDWRLTPQEDIRRIPDCALHRNANTLTSQTGATT